MLLLQTIAKRAKQTGYLLHLWKLKVLMFGVVVERILISLLNITTEVAIDQYTKKVQQ